MVVPPEFVLMIQPMSRQGALWQAILRSQNLSVIWEHPDVRLPDSFKYLKSAEVPLPHLLLIDTRVQSINAFSVCRWCRDHYPEVRIVLVNGAQKEICPSERQWAICQGAADLLPRFQRDRLVSGAVARVRRILELLDRETLDSGALVNSLISATHGHYKGERSKQPETEAEFYKHEPRILLDLF
jgi:CheY-like chemotaxis protein